MEVYLQVDCDNIDDLQDEGFDVELDDELTCEVIYDVNPADPDVGINSPSCDVRAVECNGVDVSRFFCLEDLCESAEGYEQNALEDAKCEAAEARYEQMREERFV